MPDSTLDDCRSRRLISAGLGSDGGASFLCTWSLNTSEMIPLCTGRGKILMQSGTRGTRSLGYLLMALNVNGFYQKCSIQGSSLRY